MNSQDRAAIEYLFEKIARVEQRSGPRDRGAEALIQTKISEQPAAPYYMAQTIVAQEKALNEAQGRIEDLETRVYGTERRADARGPWDTSSRWGGGGFLAGAAQTALGVTGGVLLGNMLADWLTPDETAPGQSVEDTALLGGQAEDVQIAEAGDFGDFDIGDF
jgi:hypothetical protein